MAATKEVFICLNSKNETLYNKTLGTWNDGVGKRDGSSVWTFSARHPAEESKTIARATEWLESLGHTDLTFQLATVEYVDKKWRVVVDEVPFGDDEVTDNLPAVEGPVEITAEAPAEEATVETEEVLELSDNMVEIPMNEPEAEVSDEDDELLDELREAI